MRFAAADDNANRPLRVKLGNRASFFRPERPLLFLAPPFLEIEIVRTKLPPTPVCPPRPAAALGRALLLTSCLLGASAPVLAGNGDWIEYVDESSTRIVTSSGLGLIDPDEKDLVTGDIDNDGDTDLVILRKVPFSVAGGRRNLLFLNENGILVDRTNTLAPDLLDPTDDRDGSLVDLNGDGWRDLVIAGTFGEQPRVLINRGPGLGDSWLGLEYEANRLPVFSPAPKFCSVSVGDVTGDTWPDLFFTDYDNTLEDRLLINNGSGVFTDETSSRMTPAMSFSAFGSDSQIVDLNSDGFLDIVKNNAAGNAPPPNFRPNVSVLYNDGTGNFEAIDEIYSVASYMTEVADFTQDGKLDLFIVDDSQDRFLVNLGNGEDGFANFQARMVTTSPRTSFFGGNVHFADLDNDRILDVLVADVDTDIGGCDRRLTLLRGLGTPPNITYGDPLAGADRPWLQYGTFDVAAFHIDDDGVLDLWIGTCEGNRVFMGRSANIFRDGFESGDTSAWAP